GLDVARSLYPGLRGAGTAVAVIDSGIDYKFPLFGGGKGPKFKVVDGKSFTSQDATDFLPMKIGGKLVDNAYHGTGISWVIGVNPHLYCGEYYEGIAPDTKLIGLKVSVPWTGDVAGMQTEASRQVQAALQWVEAHREQYNIVAVNITEPF